MWRVVTRRLFVAVGILGAAAIVATLLVLILLGWWFGPIGPDD